MASVSCAPLALTAADASPADKKVGDGSYTSGLVLRKGPPRPKPALPPPPPPAPAAETASANGHAGDEAQANGNGHYAVHQKGSKWAQKLQEKEDEEGEEEGHASDADDEEGVYY